MGKGIWLALGVAMLLALAPGASAATVRHASPTGGTTGTCTDGEPPCSLKYAVETVAVAGDDVVLAPGLYEPTSLVNISKPIQVHGEAGQARPRVVRATGGVFLVGGSGTLSDMQLESVGTVLTDASVVERVTVLGGPAPAPLPGSFPPSAARIANGGVLRDSLVRTEAGGGAAVYATSGVSHIVNVTAIATDAEGIALFTDSTSGGICLPESSVELHAANVIARGGKYDAEVRHICGGSGSPPRESIHMTHSNFRREKVFEARPEAHFEEEGGNQEVEPLFASPPSLDFHQLAGSPTVDAGVVTPLLGSADIDGEPRTQGSAPDIGADEFVPPVVEPPVDMRRPVLSLLAVTPGRFRVAAARSARARRGTRISYALDEAATVTFTFKKIVKRLFHGRKRTAYRPMRGSFTQAGKVGGNRLRFSGRLGGRKLRRGLYRLIALPVDAAGNTGNAVFVRFRIVR